MGDPPPGNEPPPAWKRVVTPQRSVPSARREQKKKYSPRNRGRVNVLACNTDAHAKNYSIMIRAGGTSLAPMYDVMCGEVWENVTKNLAQKIAGKSRGDHLKGRHWQRFARECGLNPKQVIDRVGALAKSVIAETGAAQSEVAAMPAGGHAILDLPFHLGNVGLIGSGGIHGGKKNSPDDSGAITFSGTFSGTLVGARSGAGAGAGV
jgi:hypothetical protein